MNERKTLKEWLIGKLGGVPIDEWASADHRRQIAEGSASTARRELDEFAEAYRTEKRTLLAQIDFEQLNVHEDRIQREYEKEGWEAQINRLEDTVRRHEEWANEHGHELPPDTEALWAQMYAFEKAWHFGDLSEHGRKRQQARYELLARWTGVPESTLAYVLSEQVSEYMADCGEGPASDFYVPNFEHLKECGIEGIAQIVTGASPVAARDMGL